MKSLFAPFQENGLTSLKIQYDWRTGNIRLMAAKEWDAGIDFSQYNKTFYAENILTDDAVFLNTKQVRKLYEDYDLSDHLEAVIDLIKAGKHYGIEAYYYDQYNIRFMHFQHSRRMGLKNKRRGMFTGGTRRHELETPEIDVIRDGLNLSRAMSYKNVPAGVQYGGGKTVIHMAPLDLSNKEQLGFIAYAIDKCKTMGTPDMRLPKEMVGVMRDHFSVQWIAGPDSPLGSSGIPTAYGVFHAMKQAYRFKTGSADLAGVSVAIQGFGEVGGKIAELLAEEGAVMMIAGPMKPPIEAFIAKYPNLDITVVPRDEILNVEADIFCPCAIGGIIREENIPNLKFKIIIGGANNQLYASSVEEEIRLAQMLDKHGILFQADFWHNCGGVIVAIDEYELWTGTTFEAVVEKVTRRVSKLTWEKLNEAKEKGITPTEAIYRECEERIY